MDPTVELATDGFPLDPADPDIRFHRELSAWLELEKPDRGPVALRFDPPAERSRWLRPALRRFAWVRSHGELIAGDRRLDARLAHLIGHLVNGMYPPYTPVESALAELAAHVPALDTVGAGSMFRADAGRLLLAAAKAGIASRTREHVHAMLRALAPADRFGSMHELAWHLYLDENDPDDGEPCWSAVIRREVRALKPAARKPWMALLKLAPIRQAPDARWAEKVRKAVEKIGRVNWENRAGEWGAMARGSESVSRPAHILARHFLEINQVLESKPPAAPDRSELITLMGQGSHAAFEQIAEYTKQHGYQIEIVEAVRQYHDTLHGSVTDQARRQHVGWWLWLEDVTPIKTEECWSSIVRADLRGFTGERKKAWLELIGNMTFAVVAKPPAKWTKVAEAALKAVGPEDFRNQMRRWLKPMDEDKPLRLTTPGRDVLRCLIWDASLCPPDPQLDEALSWIGKAAWKNKESRDRLSKIAGPLNDVLSASHPEGVMTVAKPVPKPYDPQAAMDKAMSQVLKSQPLGDRIEIHLDHIFVRGERDHYRIAMDGVVTRRSGRTVRVNMDQLPNYITQLVRPAIDALDLEQGMFQPNPMRLFSLATILAHDAQWESAIE
jgi:hypothetical protein